MQAFPATDRYYGHGQQPPYGQQPAYFQQFPGYGYPPPGPQPIAAPFPVYPPHYDQLPPSTPHMQAGRPRPLARESSRASTPGRPDLKPLKSAMKRTKTPDRAASVGAVPLSRGRSGSIRRQRTRSGSRMRSGSVPKAFTPDHLLLTLHSTNQLLLENIPDSNAGDELTEAVLPIWPRGANTIENRRGKWRVEFAGHPWSCSGLEAIMAGKMICRLYLILARLGYTYLSTINVGNPWKPPSMIFVDSTPDYEAQVFLIMFSKRGDRLTILDGPPELTQQLGIDLRATFPRKITTDRATEDGLHIFEVKKGSYGSPAVDKSILIAFVLRFFNYAGFRLSGSVPMGTKGLLSFGHRKEMWIFRSDPWRPGIRQDARPESRQSRLEGRGA
ncbi:hypothetical protein BV20DRAFT_1125960 [Pilatotrama ljubarskyi]|nr:hypothetical protein BV20DRAFT_1125960 [Pilatotrama ljubarskyi]